MTDLDLSVEAMHPGTGEPPGCRHREPVAPVVTWRVYQIPIAVPAGSPSIAVTDCTGRLVAVFHRRDDAQRAVELHNANALGGR